MKQKALILGVTVLSAVAVVAMTMRVSRHPWMTFAADAPAQETQDAAAPDTGAKGSPGSVQIVAAAAAGGGQKAAGNKAASQPVPGARECGWLLSTLSTLRDSIELYKLQHLDLPPDVARYRRWEQLTGLTTAQGRPVPAGKAQEGKAAEAKAPGREASGKRGGPDTFGPYLQHVPVNSLNGLDRVMVIKDPARPGQRVPRERVGFVYCNATGEVWATDETGSRVADEAVVAERVRAEFARRWAEHVAAPPRGSTPQTRLTATRKSLVTARRALSKWSRRDRRAAPDFARYPGWEQFREPDAANGRPDADPFDGYLHAPPRNELNGCYRVQVVSATPAKDFTARGEAGYVYDTSTGILWATDRDGKLLAE